MELVGAGAKTKTNDVQGDGGEQFEGGLALDAAGEVLGHIAAPVDDGGEAVGAVGLQGHGHFERAQASGQVGAEVAGPGRVAGEAALLAREIGERLGEGLDVQGGVADQDAAGVVGDLRPFVEVEGEAVGALDAAELVAVAVGDGGQRGEGAVDMEPEVFAGAELGDRAQIVDGPAIDGAGGGGDEERAGAGGAVPPDGLGEGFEVEAVIGIGGKGAERVAAEAGHVEGARDAAMRGAGGVGGQRCGAQALAAAIGAEAGLAGDEDGDEVGDRGAGDEQAGGFGGHADHGGGPADHLALELDAGMVAAAAIHVQAGGEELGQHADGGAAAMDPAHEAGVGVAGGVGHDGAAEVVVEGGGVAALAREPGVAEFGADGVGQLLPDGAVSPIAQVVDHVVDHAVAERPEVRPVVGVKSVHGDCVAPCPARDNAGRRDRLAGVLMFFEGFGEAQTIDVGGEPIRLRRGGTGPAVLLLHGHPQTHAMWHAVAPMLAERFAVIVPDLPGYGGSRPLAGANTLAGTKDSMARRMVALLDALGIEAACVVGHDRGGRVAHRMALGWPERVSRLALLDLVPVPVAAERDDMAWALATYRAFWFAQAHPKPESLLYDAPPVGMAGTLPGEADGPFHPQAADDYLAQIADVESMAALNEAYRLAAERDVVEDRLSRAGSARVSCPTLVLWGRLGRIGGWYDPVALWRECVSGPVTGAELEAGHFLAEEQPGLVAEELVGFLSAAG